MQFKNLLLAVGLVATASAAAVAQPAPVELEARAESAGFKIRRFSPKTSGPVIFSETNTPDNSWNSHEYVNIAGAVPYFQYGGVGLDKAATFTIDEDGVLRGSNSGTGGLAARNLQSYGVTLLPITFGGAGELVKVTIGPAPLYEVKFNTVRNSQVWPGWNGQCAVDGKLWVGKKADVPEDIAVRFRAVGYTPPVVATAQ